MKGKILLLVFCMLSLSVFAKKGNTIHLKTLGLTLVKVPGGIYFSQEITNGQYRAFLTDLAKQGRAAEVARYTPDSTQWHRELNYSKPMVQYYFSHPAYSNYPVVAITQEAAMSYCAWVAQLIKADAKLALPQAICSLPTEKDWVIASAPFLDNPYPWYGPYAYNEKGDMLCNVRINQVNPTDYSHFNADITAPPVSYYPNRYGLYNMIGNVAELTSEGYVKGGGWGNTIDECAVNKRQDYALPNANVGFRIAVWPNGVAVSQPK